MIISASYTACSTFGALGILNSWRLWKYSFGTLGKTKGLASAQAGGPYRARYTGLSTLL